MKTIRTMLYGDCEFYEWEIELIHTPIIQRMYHIKQLGFTDKVYPDAIHSRFNHVLGVVERAEKIICGVIKSLEKEASGGAPQRTIFEYTEGSIKIKELIAHIKNRRQAIRLIGLLHDIGHIPFGHTLEDELKVFSVSHDDPKRQIDFFNILTKEFLYAIIISYLPEVDIDLIDIITKNESNDSENDKLIQVFNIAIGRIEERYQNTNAEGYYEFLLNLRTSMVGLLYLEDLHKNKILDSERKNIRDNAISNLFITKVIDSLKEKVNIKHQKESDFNIHIDAFMLDIIGNTICADLLDYAKRDCKQAGLKYDYDDRIFKYFTLATYKHKSPDNLTDTYIHLCLQLFTNKLRSDVVSEIITILRTRYLLSERVLYHPTKCAVGAMLGCAVSMMGISKAELDFFRIGDGEFLRLLEKHVQGLYNIINEISQNVSANEGRLLEMNKIISVQGIEEQKMDIFFNKYSDTYKNTNNLKAVSSSFLKLIGDAIKELNHSENELFDKANNIQTSRADFILSKLRERIFAAKKLMWQIQARQYFKVIFRVSKIGELSPNIKKNLAQYFKQSDQRYKFERTVEEKCGLPYGSIVIHCPKFDTAYKEANVLVFGTDPTNVIPFKEIDDETHELMSLKDYVQEAKALETSYLSIWNMYFYVQPSQIWKWPFINIVLERSLNDLLNLTRTISNSSDVTKQLERDYADPAKNILETLNYIKSDECDPKPSITLEFIEYIENAVYYKKKGNLHPATLVEEWNKKLAHENKRKK